jgi:K+-sensing histidine kinase KdpD
LHTSSAAGASGKLPDADRHHIETVYRNANLLLTHGNDLLDISKLEAGHMDMHYSRADLTRIVRLAASHFESLAQQRQITYTVQTPETLPAEVDPDKIGRILFNLLGNAFKFAPAGGRVRCILGTREVAGNPCATLAVHDSGPGDRSRAARSGTRALPLHGSGRCFASSYHSRPPLGLKCSRKRSCRQCSRHRPRRSWWRSNPRR